MKKILYLHGLNSTLQEDRRKVLENYTLEILAPQIAYEKKGIELVEKMAHQYACAQAIIGSSAGGLLAYYLSAVLSVPALIFNPAMPFAQQIPKLPSTISRNKFLLAVLGARDKVINPHESFQLLNTFENENHMLEIHWRAAMEHSFPISVFNEECDYFFGKVQIII